MDSKRVAILECGATPSALKLTGSDGGAAPAEHCMHAVAVRSTDADPGGHGAQLVPFTT